MQPDVVSTRHGPRSHGLGNELQDVCLGLSCSLREAWEVM